MPSTSIPLSSTAWTNMGPAPIGSGASAYSGRIAGIAGDPTNANIIYVAVGTGGVWKTINSGVKWTPLTDNLTDGGGKPLAVFTSSIAIDPTNANIVYAGTGDLDGGYYGRGLLKSTNAGTTWSLLDDAGVFSTTAISRIIVSPANHNILYAAVNNEYSANAGIYKSIDAGATWARTSLASVNDFFSDLVIDRNTPTTLYAAIGYNAAAGVYKSINSGATWNLLPAAPNGVAVGRTTLALASDFSTLYVSMAGSGNGNTGGDLVGFLKTTNGGTSFTDLTATTPHYLGANGFFQGGYDTTLAVQPGNANVVFAGGSYNGGAPGFIESTDGGLTWSTIITNADNSLSIHTDSHAVAFDANGRLLEGDDGGIYRLNNRATNAIQWVNLNGNLATTQFVGIALDPSNANVAYGGTQDNGTLKFTDAQAWTQIVGGDGGFVRVDNTNSQIVYHAFDRIPNTTTTNLASAITANQTSISVTGFAGFPDSGSYNIKIDDETLQVTAGAGTTTWTVTRGVDGTTAAAHVVNSVVTQYDSFFQRSNDGGSTFTTKEQGIAIGDPSRFYLPYVIDPSNQKRLLLGTDRLYETLNRGDAWAAIGTPGVNGFNPGDFSIDAIAVAPSDTKTIYVAAGGHVFVTSNGTSGNSTTWTQIDVPGFSDTFRYVAVDPLDSQTAYIVRDTFSTGTLFTAPGSGGHVFKTSNGGAAWSDISASLPNMPVRSIILDPRGTTANRTVYIGTDVGVYATKDNGATWAAFLTGLANAPVTEMDIAPNLGILAAGTYGRGLFETQLYSTTIKVTGGNLVVADIAQGGQNDTLTIQANTATNQYVITDPNRNLAVFGITGAVVSANSHTATVPFAAVTGTLLNFNTAAGNDSLTVDTSLGAFPKQIVFDGGAGTDALVRSSGDNTWSLTGANAGDITGLVSSFKNVENLSGGTGRDVFKFGASGSLTGTINGGAGKNWLDYSALGSVIVNLSTGVATRVGAVSNVNNVIGSAAGGDKLIGNAAGGVLLGHGAANSITAGSGRSVLIGGFGVNTLTGGAADDLIINGRTTYDTNFATLEAILGIWQGAQTYSQRIAALQAAGPNQLKINTTVFIAPGQSSGGGPRYGRGNFIYQSNLIGNGGANWFITSLSLTVLDRKAGEVVTVS